MDTTTALDDPIFLALARHHDVNTCGFMHPDERRLHWRKEGREDTTWLRNVLSADFPSFSFAPGTGGDRYLKVVMEGAGGEKVEVVSTSRYVLVRIFDRMLPHTLLATMEGEPVTRIVDHPMLRDLQVDGWSTSDDDLSHSFNCIPIPN